MVDTLSKRQRSYCMSRIRSRNTGLEREYAKCMKAHGLKGFHYGQNIAGKPDFVFPKYKIALFLDGCFWHGCPKCYREPKTNRAFWRNKILGNKKRDRIVDKFLRQNGWRIMRIWGHQVKSNPERCVLMLAKMFENVQ